MYTGFYINLDRRPELRAEMESELSRVGLRDRYTRFPAIDGRTLSMPNSPLKPGELGCFLSHTKLLEQNLGSATHLHVIEDDTIFSSAAAQAIARFAFEEPFADYDILFTDVAVPLKNTAFKACKSFYDATVKRDPLSNNITEVVFSVIDLKGVVFGSTASYLVNKNAIAKTHKLFAEEFAREPQLPIDLFIRKLVNQDALKVGCIFPFVTTVRLDHILETDIVRSYKGMSALAMHLARYSFFIEANLSQCEAVLHKYIQLPTETDQHTKILNHLLAYSLTPAYEVF